MKYFLKFRKGSYHIISKSIIEISKKYPKIKYTIIEKNNIYKITSEKRFIEELQKSFVGELDGFLHREVVKDLVNKLDIDLK